MSELILDDRETRLARRRYDRIAPIYDALEWGMEWRARRWRRELWSRVGIGRVLEMGVGTGKNIRYYPERRDIVAMDISEKMLVRARRRAERLGSPVELELGDAQALSYPDASFDVVVATFLFCSVPTPCAVSPRQSACSSPADSSSFSSTFCRSGRCCDG